MKCYLCKFIPPRSDFLATMSENEKKWMGLHAAYMNDLMAKGLIVAHGPVIDETGGYGVSLYKIADDQDISALTSKDPIVMNGVGHYEHYSMLGLATLGDIK